MERLTEQIGDIFQCNNKNCMLSYCDRGCDQYNLIIKKLWDYEDLELTPQQIKQIDALYREKCEELAEYKKLEEQGLFLRLPVQEGSTVFCIAHTTECEYDFECPLVYDEYKCEADIYCEHQYKKYFIKEVRFNHMMLGIFGKSAFITKEEAEQRLAEIRGEFNG